MLGDSNEDGLVVRRRVDRRKTVSTSRETARNGDGKNAALVLVVEALEERKGVRVRGHCRVQRGKFLDDDVRVATDVALVVDNLRRGEEVLLRVDEVARLEVLDRHLDGEVGVGRDRRAILGVDKLGRGHVRRRRDDTHRRRVTGTLLDLLAVRDSLVHRGAEVDKVVRGRERGNLVRGGTERKDEDMFAGLRKALTSVDHPL